MLAIIIPYYKLSFFEKTLDSLVIQTDKRFNVYVGDDCSPEDPIGVIKEVSTKINIKYTKFKTNLGSVNLTAQWDRCIKLSSDEPWIMILGDDDVLGDNVVEEFYKAVAKNSETDLYRFSSQMIDAHNRPIGQQYCQPNQEYGYVFYGRKLQFLTRCSLSEHIFRRSMYNKVGFYSYPLAWCSDDRFFLEMSEKRPAVAINNATIYPRNSEINISGDKANNFLKGEVQLQFYEWVWERYRKKMNIPSRLALLSIYRQVYSEIYPEKNSLKFLKKYLEAGDIKAFLSYCKNLL